MAIYQTCPHFRNDPFTISIICLINCLRVFFIWVKHSVYVITDHQQKEQGTEIFFCKIIQILKID